ncbi:Por secretion system C-terminal sorting domain-containing protein [Dyadobacter sp. SG02]|uniref:T9SS type A sorting domain-containing protein n=1 Tax=Dyadobacter sp. SG02 TaxID=1855291 RepID=UPI0008AC73F8|nr:T9SS type A sorting domain-containing protein [Dyadobacter sp. SG02]SEI52298.1 Por secretion system C-terminal sorting domain-containing protein [Dyadobacter sp. SG02]
MKSCLLIVTLLLSAFVACAQYPVWEKRSGNWSDASGWSTGQVPGRNQTVGINSSCEVIVTGEVFAGIIYVDEQGKINIGETGTLHVNNSGTYGAIRMFDRSQLIVNGKLIMGDTNPLYGDGIAASYYRSFPAGAKPDIIVNKTGSIAIGNTTGAGIFLFSGGSITNHGTIEIGKFGPIGFAEGENLISAGIFTSGASFTNTGIITVDDVQALPGKQGNTGIAVSPGLFNTGEVRIGQRARITGDALVVGDTASNAGLILIDNARDGFALSKLNNTGQIKIGQSGPISNRGVYSMRSTSLIANQGDILIDNTGGNAINLGGVNITNQKNILIGKTGRIGGSAFGLSSSVIDNQSGGVIQAYNCGSHNIRLSGSSVVTNAGITDAGGTNNAKNDALYLDNSRFTNAAGGFVKLDKAKKSGVHLVKGQFDNRGTVRLIQTDTIPVLLQNASVFTNSGILDASASDGTYGGGIAVTEGSRFENQPGAGITLNRPSLISTLPALYIRDAGSRFVNNASLSIGEATSPLPYHAIQVDQNASLANEKLGLIKVGNTQQNGLMILNESEFVNNGALEFYNVAGSPFYAASESQLSNDGTIKTGLGSVFSKESVYLDGNVVFKNRPRGELYLNKVTGGSAGLVVKAGSRVENDGKIVWGNAAAFQGTAALQLSNGGVFENRQTSVLEFSSLTGDAIVCDAVTGATPRSNFTNDGSVRFGNIAGRGFYNTDPTFPFRNNNVFETLPGGKMNLQALVSSPGASSKLNNADGSVTLAFAFTNNGTVTNGGAFSTQATFTNNNAVINNGTWNAADVFNNNNRYQGSGVFKGALFSNKANLVPGNSPGCASFENGLTMLPGATLRIEVNGKTACTEFDQVSVTGTASLSGILNVTFGGGYVPGNTDAITILKSTALSGTFESNNLPAGWALVYNKPSAGDVTLSRAGALPLRLVEFTVRNEGNAAFAAWRTTEEENTSHFDLERSADGRQFQKVGTIAAINEAGVHDYNFTDRELLPGRSYYRLKMEDWDRTYSYSRILAFENGTSVTSAIYPNPARDIVKVNVSESGVGQTIRVISQAGKILLTRHLPASGTQTVDVSAIPAGIYLMKVGNGETYKLVKE